MSLKDRDGLAALNRVIAMLPREDQLRIKHLTICGLSTKQALRELVKAGRHHVEFDHPPIGSTWRNSQDGKAYIVTREETTIGGETPAAFVSYRQEGQKCEYTLGLATFHGRFTRVWPNERVLPRSRDGRGCRASAS